VHGALAAKFLGRLKALLEQAGNCWRLSPVKEIPAPFRPAWPWRQSRPVPAGHGEKQGGTVDICEMLLHPA
jgi:hypothetical protein